MIVSQAGTEVAAVVSRLQNSLQARGITLFAVIDHAAGAREVGLELADEVVLVFGNPKAGTGLMQEDPRVGLELPLRILVWAQDGTTRVGYQDPRELAGTYSLAGHSGALEAMAGLLHDLVAEVTTEPPRG